MTSAEKTRRTSQPGILVLAVNKTPDKSILKKRYPERSNRGQPPPSNDVHSTSFQLNMCATSIESVNLPENVRIIQGNLSRDQNAKFGHCEASDLAMSAIIASEFVQFHPNSDNLRSIHHN